MSDVLDGDVMKNVTGDKVKNNVKNNGTNGKNGTSGKGHEWHYRNVNNAFLVSHLETSLVDKCDDLIEMQLDVMNQIDEVLKKLSE